MPNKEDAGLLIVSHLNLMVFLQAADGVLSEAEMTACAQTVSLSFGWTPQQVGEVIDPIARNLASFNAEERRTCVLGSIGVIAEKADPAFRRACYNHYLLIARSDGVTKVEGDFLTLVRRAWALDESPTEIRKWDPSALHETSDSSPMPEFNRNMVVGGIICLIGILVTAFTYQAAEPGGSYLVAWGAIVFGGIQFIKGLVDSD